jgi:hypothetical protein
MTTVLTAMIAAAFMTLGFILMLWKFKSRKPALPSELTKDNYASIAGHQDKNSDCQDTLSDVSVLQT